MYNFTKNIRNVTPYTPGEQPEDKEKIKLNTNENPYPAPKSVTEAISGISRDTLKRYPSPGASALVNAVAKEYNVYPENVFVGVGSDDVLGMSFLTFFNGSLPVLFPDITYSFYPVWAELFKIPYEKKPLGTDFRIKLSDYACENGGIVIPNPNAPTGIAESQNFFKEILDKNGDSVVIIDEAYVDFGAESVVPLTKKYENLLVVGTFSKSRSMAGVRIGFAIGSKILIDALNAVKNSYNSYTLSAMQIAAGVAAINERDYFKQNILKIVKTRENTMKRLTALGFTCLPSSANFIFATHKKLSAKAIFEYLRKKHIYVRYFDAPRIDNFLRITIGTDTEMEALISALKDIV